MFKKLVTNLPYSPGLLKQVGFYSRRLKQEEFSRRLGVIFTVLAMLLNFNLVFFAPEASVLASPGNDVVAGGIYGSSAKEIQDNAIKAMQSSPVTRAIFDYYGITEEDIRGTTLSTINTGNEAYRSVGRQAFGRGEEVCRTHNGVRFCERSMNAAYRYRSINVRALVGVRNDRVGSSDPWFALIESCGNVVIRVGGDEEITLDKKLVPNQDKTVSPGDEVTYRLNIKSHNQNGAKDPIVVDTLPEDTRYVSHYPRDLFDRVSTNGNKVTFSSSRGDGIGPNSEYNLDITVRVLDSAQDQQRLCNAAKITSQSDTATNSNDPCVVVEIPTPEPICSSLRIINFDRNSLTHNFEVSGDGDGDVIEGFRIEFGDGQEEFISTKKTKATTSHTYAQYGKYNVKAFIKTEAGFSKASGACTLPLTTSPPPITLSPSIECDYLQVARLSRDTVKLTVAGSEYNGGLISTYVIEVNGEKVLELANDEDNIVESEYRFTQPGDYEIKAYAKSSNAGDSDACSAEHTVEPEVCPYDESLFVGDEGCTPPSEEPPHIVARKFASNLTRDIEDAHNTVAGPGDIIQYRLTAQNDGGQTMQDFVIEESLTDVLQYADIHDSGGGELMQEEQAQRLVWPASDIAPGETLSKTFSVKVKNPIPATPVSNSDPRAFDLMMENVYGNNVTVKLPTSTPKQIEQVTAELPETGPGENLVMTLVVVGTASYFYSRNRLISKELGMIRAEFSGGSI